MSTGTIRSALVAAAAARLSFAALRRHPPGGAQLWNRTNHRGDEVTLLEGPALVIGGIAGALAAGSERRGQLALVIASAGAGAFGGLDDLAGDGGSRGFRGHLGALRNGELTTGIFKLAGISATGIAAALVADPVAGATRGSTRPVRLADRAINAALVAGSANLVNLFDLRPGRAIKVAGLAGCALAGAPASLAVSAAPLAAAAALLPDDLAEHAMLGDAGANALGAMLGVAAATRLPRWARLTALAVITGLTAASEVVSFTQVIERTGPLRRLDMLGRRPAGEPAGAGRAAATDQEPPADHDAATDPAQGNAATAPRHSAQAR
jgi:hypothetical protein